MLGRRNVVSVKLAAILQRPGVVNQRGSHSQGSSLKALACQVLKSEGLADSAAASD